MPSYSQQSKDRLATCHKDLQTIFNIVIKFFDCTILCGERTPAEQFELFKKGRKLKDGQWIKDADIPREPIVTYKDGFKNKSKHNYSPSLAVDAVPYPVDFKDTDRMSYFAGFVMGIAKLLKDKGIIDNEIVWGGDFSNDTILENERFVDKPHYQIK